jgi:hypothetical protein
MNNEQRAQAMVQLVAGLIASGHYTIPAKGNCGPEVMELSHGDDWKECGQASHWQAHAVIDASDLLDQIVTEVKHQRALEDEQ